MLALAGGKGINVARALKRLDVPVVATGLAGGRTGTRIVEELTAEAILNDFVRIRDESRTSTAVLDPTSGTYTEINEWGPKVTESELEILLDKLRYLSRGADGRAGGLPAARRRRRLLRRGDARADAARRARRPRRRGRAAHGAGSRPSRGSSRRTSTRPSSSSARSSRTTTTSLMALDAIAEMGARNVQHHAGDGLLRARARGAPGAAATGRSRRSSSPCRSSGRVTCSSRSGSRRSDGKPADEALRLACAAGAASVLVVGADASTPKDVARLAVGRAGRVVDLVGAGSHPALRVCAERSRGLHDARTCADAPSSARRRRRGRGLSDGWRRSTRGVRARPRQQVRQGRPDLRRRAARPGRVGRPSERRRPPRRA